MKEDPWVVIPREHKVGDVVEGEVIRFVPYGVFIRVFDDINGLIHLSEMSHKNLQNPSEIVKLGQIIKAKIILLDPRNRKIGLSMKLDVDPNAAKEPRKYEERKPAAAPEKKTEQE